MNIEQGKIFCTAFAAAALFLSAAASAQVNKLSFRTISITSEPNTIVWIDGVKYGTTDAAGKLTITTISPGRHAIKLRADGFKQTTKPLLATAKGEISIPLTRTTDEADLAFQQAETLSTSDRSKAAEAYRKAIRLKPKYTEAHVGLARVLSEGGELEEAEAAIKTLKRISPGLAEASAIEGRIYKDLGDEKRAIAAFKRAIAEGRGFQPEAYTGLGLLHKERAETAAAAANFEQEKTDYAEAAKQLAVAVKQLSGAPDAVIVFQLLGLVYEKQQKYIEAIATYEDFLRTFPTSPEAEAVRSFITQIKKQMSH